MSELSEGKGEKGWALVTGASSGIGAAFARQLARDGFDVIVVARRRERLEALARELREQHGVEVEVVAADLAAPDGLAAVEACIRRVTDLALLVNNAGFGAYRPFVDLDPAAAEALVDLHVLAVTRLTRAALPGMIERGAGAIVNVASLLAFTSSLPPRPLPARVTYAAAKAYIVAFTELLQHELAGTGVRAQVLCPGLVYTEFHNVAGVERMQLRSPPMQPEEVVSASLTGLRLGETVCAPGLEDTTLLDNLAESQRAVFTAAAASPLASRYASGGESSLGS